MFLQLLDLLKIDVWLEDVTQTATVLYEAVLGQLATCAKNRVSYFTHKQSENSICACVKTTICTILLPCFYKFVFIE